MSEADINGLVAAVEADQELNIFADNLQLIQKTEQYPKPGANWLAGDIKSDILSSLDSTFRSELLTEWKENGIPEGEIKRNYQRNKTLIDFDSIPNELGELIYNMWVDKITQNDKSKILPYFMKHRLKELTEKLGDF